MQSIQIRHDLGRLLAAQVIYPEPRRARPTSFDGPKTTTGHDFLVINPATELSATNPVVSVLQS